VYGGRLKTGERKSRRVRLEAATAEELLVAFLNELIFLIGTRHLWPARVAVRAAGPQVLEVEIAAAALPPGALAREVKAATFGGLEVRRGAGGFSATVIVDV